MLDCSRPPLATLQNGVEVWQESSGEIFPLSALTDAWVRLKVAPSGRRSAVVVPHIVVRSRHVDEPSDAIRADETPYTILQQESPLSNVRHCALAALIGDAFASATLLSARVAPTSRHAWLTPHGDSFWNLVNELQP